MLKNMLLCMISLCAYSAAESSTSFVESTINPGEKLVVSFDFPQAPITSIGEVDFFEFHFGGSFADFSTDGRNSFYEMKIFDGDTLLGIQRSDQQSRSSGIFLAPGSPGTFVGRTEIDMTSIRTGLINGKFEFIPYFDRPSEYSQIFLSWRMLTGRWVSSDSYWEGFPDPTIQNYSITAVPEPGSAIMLAAGALGLVFNYYIRRKYTLMQSPHHKHIA